MNRHYKKLSIIVALFYPAILIAQWSYPGSIESWNHVIKPADPAKNYLLFQNNSYRLGIIGSDAAIGGQNENNFGMYVYGNNNLDFWTNGVKRLIISSNGNIGVGTSSPAYKLDVVGDFNLFDDGENRDLRIRFNSKVALSSHNTQNASNTALYINLNWKPSIGFYSDFNRVIIHGLVGIGTNSENLTSKLTVAGDIRAREIKVETNAGADFVFAPDYRLRPLTEVEQFITANQHLPDIAPADSMVQNGVNMGEMQVKLLQKIEELTLYIIEQSKQNTELKELLEKQNSRTEMQQKEIEELKKKLNK